MPSFLPIADSRLAIEASWPALDQSSGWTYAPRYAPVVGGVEAADDGRGARMMLAMRLAIRMTADRVRTGLRTCIDIDDPLHAPTTNNPAVR